MTEENLKRGRQNCCRLCLAPDSECISILNSYAADKEPLVTKIHNCVHIKVTPSDGLSLRICHACISYLNSWQSFKNRCIASQGKQRNWLEFGKRQQLLENNVSISTISSSANQQRQQQQQQLQKQQQQQQEQDQFPQESNLASSILDGITSLKKRKSLTVYPLPAVQVKDEPLDEDDYDTMKHQQDESDEMVDPTLFLERTEEEGNEPYMTHVNSSMQDTSVYSYEQTPRHNIRTVPDRTTIEQVAGAAEVKEASCRACNLKFSTRANARRHERNLHPNLFELSTSTPNSTPVTRPTAALAAALELQRAAAAAEQAKKTATTLNPMAPKLRQHIVNAANATTAPTYDYDNPEQYQDLLTDEKIVFIQQNESFLQQYQTMTCKCCNKFYTSYKNFMAHMRKKYVTLPRNLCFNCLKLNDTKSLFISHLKKRNCINLYKVMHALMAKVPSFASAVAATAAAMPEKMRAKELLVNKIYECKLCTQHFRLKLEFRSHVYDEHADAQKKDVLPGQCGFCGMEIEDPLERKRHYNNMDCIVILRCVTCDEKFGNHQKFLDHVYAKHLVQSGTPGAEQQRQQQPTNILQQQLTNADNSPGKKSSGFAGTSSADESRSSTMQHTAGKSQYFSRMPQACPICGQQYNNYNNVLRHMESKHPDQLPQTYKCVKCGKGYPRLSNLREHMLTVHSATANIEKTRSTSFEYIVNADAVKSMDSGGGGGAGGSGAGAYSGRYDYVMKDLMSITNGGTCAEDYDDDDGENAPTVKKMRLDNSANVSANSNNTLNNYKECPICSAIFSNKIGLSNHMRSHAAAMQSYTGASPALRDASKTAADHKSTSAAGTNSSGVGVGALQAKTPAQQAAVFKRSLELAADRRFRRMRCRMCQKRFSSKKSYRRHMLDDHQIRNVQFIKCKLCDAEFAYEKGLKVHMFKIHNTLLKDEMIIKQYECDICSIVYRTEDQLLQHKKSVHGNENAHPDDFVGETAVGTGGGAVVGDVAGSNANSAPSVDVAGGIATPVDPNTGAPVPLYWYQCKYCPSNFNTNKKLAIHINSHDEFDSSDYSCKDCGNVYSGRKSLWVHRYKKHPQIAEPSECVLCRKVFFDAHMLENHIPTCNRKPITATGAMAEHATPLNTFYRHKTGDDEDDDGSRGADGTADGDERANSGGGAIGTLGGGEVEIHALPQVGGANSAKKIKLPEVACTICGQRFTDQELFAKHIQVHERELYTDNPLAAMFDTGPADPNQFYLDRVNDNGEYACDICTKTFTQMTALKVHRKWHFRGDSKQNPADGDPSAYATSQTHSLLHPPGLQAVGLMPNPRPSKSQKRKRELKCEYCPSTFISNNNLRRHIYELHKSEIAHWPEPPKIDLDEYLHCRKCVLKFETKKDWIDHKVADARLMKPYGPFQWGCELCGEYVSRKEKLIHHIQSHMKEQQIVPVHQRQQQQQATTANNKSSVMGESFAAESNSQDSQQSEDNGGGGDYDADRVTKEDAEEYEEDDAAVEYVGDEDQEEEDDDEDDEVGDEAGEADEDEEVREAKNEECIEIDGQVAEEEEEEDEEDEGDMDTEENIENIDENANDGQNGNDDDDMEEDDDDDEDDADDGDEDDDDETNESAKTKQQIQMQKRNKNSSDGTEVEDSMTFVNEDDDDDDDEDDEDDDEDEEVEDESVVVEQDHDYANLHADTDYIDEDEVEEVTESAPVTKKRGQAEAKTRFACDLCQVFFDTQLELQKHVKIHFLNGPGSVTLTEIRAKQVNKSRSSGSSDIVTVSSS